MIVATQHFLELTGPYNMLYMDIEHMNFSIFILSNEPDMCFLPYLLGSEQKSHMHSKVLHSSCFGDQFPEEHLATCL